jgi:hypothetical protein
MELKNGHTFLPFSLNVLVNNAEKGGLTTLILLSKNPLG